MGVSPSPCVSPYILFYIHGPAILLCFFITQISQYYSNSKWPCSGLHFKIVCSQKIIKSLADIAVHICQMKRRSAGNFSCNALTSISLLVALVIKGLIIWESKCHQKFPGGM